MTTMKIKNQKAGKKAPKNENLNLKIIKTVWKEIAWKTNI